MGFLHLSGDRKPIQGRRDSSSSIRDNALCVEIQWRLPSLRRRDPPRACGWLLLSSWRGGGRRATRSSSTTTLCQLFEASFKGVSRRVHRALGSALQCPGRGAAAHEPCQPPHFALRFGLLRHAKKRNQRPGSASSQVRLPPQAGSSPPYTVLGLVPSC